MLMSLFLMFSSLAQTSDPDMFFGSHHEVPNLALMETNMSPEQFKEVAAWGLDTFLGGLFQAEKSRKTMNDVAVTKDLENNPWGLSSIQIAFVVWRALEKKTALVYVTHQVPRSTH